MIDYPKTLEEARKHRYATKASNPKGNEYREGDCAYEVWESGRGVYSHQCRNKNGYGAEDLYCKQHAKKLGMM